MQHYHPSEVERALCGGCLVRLALENQGAPGTMRAYTSLEESILNLSLRSPEVQWWDGYAGESVVIIWDEPDSDIEFGQLLQLCDRYEHRVEVKGGFVQFIAKLIIFTSNFHPETLFAKHANYAAFSRRITLLLKCEGATYEDMKNV